MAEGVQARLVSYGVDSRWSATARAASFGSPNADRDADAGPDRHL